MTIKIRSVALKNPQDLQAAPKYYAKVVNQGEYTLEIISERIAKMSTVSKADVYAVLVALTDTIPEMLEEGKFIRLGSLGSFGISLSSNPSDLEEDVSAFNVKKLKLNFRPSQSLKKEVEAFSITKTS